MGIVLELNDENIKFLHDKQKAAKKKAKARVKLLKFLNNHGFAVTIMSDDTIEAVSRAG